MKGFKKNIYGDLGEEFAKRYCETHNISFKKASRKEDLEKGIDAYIDKKPTDIKNTKNIYIFQIYDDGVIHVRHPFKIISCATHYFFVNVTENNAEFIEHIDVREKIKRDYISSVGVQNNFRKFLLSIDVRHYNEFGSNLDQACLELKKRILQFLNKDVSVTYSDIKLDIIDFKLMKKEKIKRPSAFYIESIRTKIRAGYKTPLSEKQKIKEENIIIIPL